ncbi:MAG: signal peptidase I [Xanthomonadales bacterium]|nr:signal peptidase I [Xanthomonadales bacterium]
MSTSPVSPQRRNPWLLLLLTLFPPLAHLWIGHALRGCILAGGLLAAAASMGWSGVIHEPSGLLAMAGVMVFGLLVIEGDALILNFRSRGRSRPYAHGWIMLLAIPAYLALRVFLGPLLLGFNLYTIPSMSMAPTLLPGDLILTDDRPIHAGLIRRGRAAVLVPPHRPSIVYVQRIVGLEGDRVQLIDGVLWVNGVRIDEPYLSTHRSPRAVNFRNFGPVVVPAGTVLTMGDNRDNSEDGRVFGPVPVANIRAFPTWIIHAQRDERTGIDPGFDQGQAFAGAAQAKQGR